VVCSHYKLGDIASVTPLPRGEASAPKAVLKTTDDALYFVKRRRGNDDGSRIGLSHALHAHLASKEFPVPALLRTARSGATYIRASGHVYELYDFLPGEPFDNSLAKLRAAGAALATFHDAASDFPHAGTLPTTSFHADPRVAQQLDGVRRGAHAPAPLRNLVERLFDLLSWAGASAARAGFAKWPRRVIHGDWHPGNLVFRDERVIAVLDLDARLGPRMIDLALASLHFSTVAHAPNPAQWPAAADLDRIAGFFAGYHASESVTVGQGELRALPALMAEALIAQIVSAVSSSGAFGPSNAHDALDMAVRKAAWLKANVSLIVEAAT